VLFDYIFLPLISYTHNGDDTLKVEMIFTTILHPSSGMKAARFSARIVNKFYEKTGMQAEKNTELKSRFYD